MQPCCCFIFDQQTRLNAIKLVKIMKPKSRPEEPAQFFKQDLEHLLDQRQALYKLANRLPWDALERSFECYYKDFGRPALPTRLMAGLLLLKQLENLSDERVCYEWQSDPDMQYFFAGNVTFSGSFLASRASCFTSENVSVSLALRIS